MLLAAREVGLETALMASTTKTRTAPPRSTSKRRAATAKPGPIARAKARFAEFRQDLPSLMGSARMRREVLGGMLIIIAVLTAVVLGRGGDDGILVRWWGGILIDCFGKAAPLVPVLAGLAAIRLLSTQTGPMFEIRHVAGGFLFTIAVVGLLQLGAGLGQPQMGGYLGIAVATLTLEVLGTIGAGLVLFALGVFAVFLLAGSDLHTFIGDIGALIALFWRSFARMIGGIRRFFAMMIGWLPRAEPRQSQQVAVAAPTAPPVTSTGSRRLVPIYPDDATDEADGDDLPPIRRPDHPERTNAPRIAQPEAQQRTLTLTEPEPEDDAPIVNTPPPPKRLERGNGTGTIVIPAASNLPASARLPMPDVSRLTYYDPVDPDETALHAKAKVIEETLASFKVEAKVREINPGPAVTQFALEPGTGTKVRRITELQNDLALSLAAPSIRIEAPIPGLARVGLEIPNEHIATVGLRETIESVNFTKSKAKLPMPLGRDVNGRYVVGDLTRMPHILIAGATGAGKSVCLNGIISTFLMTKTPDELKMVMIDPKMVELTGYNGVPHLQCPVVTEMDKVVGALRLSVREMERRYTMFSQIGVRNYDGYRLKMTEEPSLERLPYLVLIIDELADLMMTTPDDVENQLVRLGQMGRAAGIHLILATQRPSVDVVTGLIKTNVPSRIAFAVSSVTDSRVVLDMPGAEKLLGRGDMLYLPADAAKPQRVQGAFIDDKDAQYVVSHWHRVAPVPQFDDEWLNLPSSNPGSSSFDGNEFEDDPLYDQALTVVRQHGTASASMLQRRLRVGYNRAARMIERMEDEGLIGPADGVRGRPVLAAER